MKKFIILLAISLNSFAATGLICNDQNSHAVYEIQLSKNNVSLLPLLKDSSVLSSSVVNLKVMEGESTTNSTLFSGINKNQNIVVLELPNRALETLNKSEIVEVDVIFSKDSKKILDQKTEFLCSEK